MKPEKELRNMITQVFIDNYRFFITLAESTQPRERIVEFLNKQIAEFEQLKE